MTSSASNLVRGREIVRNAERRRDALPSIVVFVALVGLAFENGGFFPRAWTTASVALLWVAALVLLLAARIELSSPERMWIDCSPGSSPGPPSRPRGRSITLSRFWTRGATCCTSPPSSRFFFSRRAVQETTS